MYMYITRHVTVISWPWSAGAQVHSGTHPEWVNKHCVYARHKAVCKETYMVCVGNILQTQGPEVKRRL
jgi:hypothetical protein